jgi:hypothetical protein
MLHAVVIMHESQPQHHCMANCLCGCKSPLSRRASSTVLRCLRCGISSRSACLWAASSKYAGFLVPLVRKKLSRLSLLMVCGSATLSTTSPSGARTALAGRFLRLRLLFVSTTMPPTTGAPPLTHCLETHTHASMRVAITHLYPPNYIVRALRTIGARLPWWASLRVTRRLIGAAGNLR